jgi:4-hydroxybenzoate polyprenyltransferase
MAGLRHNRGMPAALSLLRPHQWVKNLLVFVALVASHRWDQPAAVSAAVQQFIAFCLVASAVYAVNDVLDREADAAHPGKRHRPVARGAIAPATALAIAVALVLAGGAVAWPLGLDAFAALCTYALLALGYCTVLKRLLWADVLALAALYVLRVIGGAWAIGVAPSPWLLAFAGALFAGLAALKRYGDLRQHAGGGLPGRAYTADDQAPLLAIGAACSVVAVLVLALYVNSPDVRVLYARPHWIWLLCPLLLYWLARMWSVAARARLDADPIVFALRDVASWLVALACAGLIVLAL